MSTRTCSRLTSPRTIIGSFQAMAANWPGRTLTWRTSPSTGARTISRSSMILMLSTWLRACSTADRWHLDVFLPGPGHELGEVGLGLGQRRLGRLHGVAVLVEVAGGHHLLLEERAVAVVRGLGVVQPGLGLLDGRLGRRDVLGRGASARACGAAPRRPPASASRTFSSASRSRSSIRNSGSPFLTRSPTFLWGGSKPGLPSTKTSMTTPGTGVPIGMFSRWASTRPAPAIGLSSSRGLLRRVEDRLRDRRRSSAPGRPSRARRCTAPATMPSRATSGSRIS